MANPIDNRPLSELVSGLVSDITGLFRKEINLAKTEASEKMSHAVNGLEAFGAGLVFAIAAVGVLLAALVNGLAA
ncbi:MAG: phage holin family protein, partial [Pseudomonadota bacterium]|nr:phage holin family protein [Pseudomonadota bacterium]